jgi:hypothetical protein
MYGDFGQTVIVVIVGLIVFFLILREFWCWYWKINKRIVLLEEQNRLLSGINENLQLNMKISNKILDVLKDSSNNNLKNHLIDKMV